MDFVGFPKVPPNSPKHGRGQIQVRTLTVKGEFPLINVIATNNKPLHLQGVIRYYCLGVCYASNRPRFFTGHLWTDVFRQKVSYLSTSIKTTRLCACEIMLLKCLFSAVYSFNTLSFVIVKFCRVFNHPAKFVPLFLRLLSVYSLLHCADFILSRILFQCNVNI